MVQIDFFGNATEECEAPNTKWPTVDRLYRADECYEILCYLDQITWLNIYH